MKLGKWCFWTLDYSEIEPNKAGSLKEGPAGMDVA